MSAFLRENWKWIVIPIAVLVVALVLLAVLGRPENTSPFQYSDF